MDIDELRTLYSRAVAVCAPDEYILRQRQLVQGLAVYTIQQDACKHGSLQWAVNEVKRIRRECEDSAMYEDLGEIETRYM